MLHRTRAYWSLIGLLPLAAHAGSAPDVLTPLRALAGHYVADLPGVGAITSTVQVVSNGTAVQETIGTATEAEVSVYTQDGAHVLLTHFCAMTPGGHVARLESAALAPTAARWDLRFRDATNLPDVRAAHMQRVVVEFIDATHYRERWTKREHGRQTVFDLHFARQ